MDSGSPAAVVEELAIGADAAEARRATDRLEATLLRRGVPQAHAARLTLCGVEVLANVLAHGGKAVLEAPIGLLLEVALNDDHGEARVTVSDAGRAFDPLTVPERAKPRTLDEASPGGMGLALIRRCAELLQYRHAGGRNHLMFGARWNSLR